MASTQAPAIFTPSLKEIFAIALKLPAAPQIVAELGVLLQDVNANLDEVAVLLRRDAPLAASILRLGNSAYYGGGGLGSIDEAVNRVGFGEVYRLVGCAATTQLADRALAFYGVEAEALREHMVATALACEALADESGFNPREAYTAGLLRPIGMMVLDRLARLHLAPTDAYRPDRDANYGVWERQVLHIQNAAVTAVVLREWSFSSVVVDAVRGHAFEAHARAATQGAAILHLAGRIVNEMGHGLPGEHEAWTLDPRILEIATLHEDQVMGSLDRVKAHFDLLRPSLH
jgi:HD-like signal output (HDOD) protein